MSSYVDGGVAQWDLEVVIVLLWNTQVILKKSLLVKTPQYINFINMYLFPKLHFLSSFLENEIIVIDPASLYQNMANF